MILDTIKYSKHHFNVDSEADIKRYTNFLKTLAWGKAGCPFILENPHDNIPDMIKDKLIHKFLKVKRVTE